MVVERLGELRKGRRERIEKGNRERIDEETKDNLKRRATFFRNYVFKSSGYDKLELKHQILFF